MSGWAKIAEVLDSAAPPVGAVSDRDRCQHTGCAKLGVVACCAGECPVPYAYYCESHAREHGLLADGPDDWDDGEPSALSTQRSESRSDRDRGPEAALCECESCCDGEHPGDCQECAGWGETDGVWCAHCEGTGQCPVCDGRRDPAHPLHHVAADGPDDWEGHNR